MFFQMYLVMHVHAVLIGWDFAVATFETVRGFRAHRFDWVEIGRSDFLSITRRTVAYIFADRHTDRHRDRHRDTQTCTLVGVRQFDNIWQSNLVNFLCKSYIKKKNSSKGVDN